MAALVTTDELEDYLQRTVTPATATLAVAGASGVVRAYCGWSISEEDTTFVVDGTSHIALFVPTMRLTAVTEVRIDGEVADPETYSWSEYGMFRRDAGWAAKLRGIEIDATHGWDPVPDVIRLVTLGLAAREYSNPDRLREATVGTVTRIYGPPTALETALLDPYRI